MTVADALKSVSFLFLDTAPVIYFVERNPTCEARVDDIFDRIDTGSVLVVTSPITLAECLVMPIRKGLPTVEQDFTDLIVSGANVTFATPDAAIARQTAEFRARYKLGLADAFQVATAIATGCDALLTNDFGFKCVTEIPILVLDDLTL